MGWVLGWMGSFGVVSFSSQTYITLNVWPILPMFHSRVALERFVSPGGWRRPICNEPLVTSISISQWRFVGGWIAVSGGHCRAGCVGTSTVRKPPALVVYLMRWLRYWESEVRSTTKDRLRSSWKQWRTSRRQTLITS